MPFVKSVDKSLTPEQIQNRGRIESLWRTHFNHPLNTELVMSEEEWQFHEKLLKMK